MSVYLWVWVSMSLCEPVHTGMCSVSMTAYGNECGSVWPALCLCVSLGLGVCVYELVHM